MTSHPPLPRTFRALADGGRLSTDPSDWIDNEVPLSGSTPAKTRYCLVGEGNCNVLKIVTLYFLVKCQREARWPGRGGRPSVPRSRPPLDGAYEKKRERGGAQARREEDERRRRCSKRADTDPLEIPLDVAPRLPVIGGVRLQARLHDVDELAVGPSAVLRIACQSPISSGTSRSAERQYVSSAPRPSRIQEPMYARRAEDRMASRLTVANLLFRQPEVENLDAAFCQHQIALVSEWTMNSMPRACAAASASATSGMP